MEISETAKAKLRELMKYHIIIPKTDGKDNEADGSQDNA